jgi:microcystin degradation protein MlrC
MRILVGGIKHETNLFSNILTSMREFRERELLLGDEIPAELAGTSTEIGGFLQVAKELDIEPVFTVMAAANPAGAVVRSAYDELCSHILDGLRREKVDGVYLALHGAMCVDGVGDGEGTLLKMVRNIVGPDMPVVATLDLHTLLTDAMIDNADALVIYKTYPHIDAAERAMDATRLLARIVKGEIHPVVASRKLALAPPPTKMYTNREPMVSVGRRMVEMEQSGQALSASFNHTFPWADVPYLGAGSLVYTDGNPALAQQLAGELADYVWQRREMLWHTPTTISDAVERALQHNGAPVVIADVSDNPGGGTASDGVEVLRELIRRKVSPAAFGTVWDPGAVEMCWNAGVEAEIDLRIGGKVDRFHGLPLDVRGTVERLSDGEFTYKGPMSRGAPGSMGRAAVLRVGDIKIILNSSRTQPFDPEIFRCVGIEPTEQRIVVVKSMVHFRAAFEPLASLIIEADGPGISSLDYASFPYRNAPRPMYGIDRY